MTSAEIRQKFLSFFEKRGHTIIPSSSLVPQNDPTVLFNTAGMQPLVPYLLGASHPQGKRLVNIQKCVRTVDIEDIGDNTHATFFEMMGNWSLGDYFKKEAIEWSYELLTSKEGFGLNPNRLYVTCFEGDNNAPKDEESANIWQEIFNRNGVSGERVFYLPADKNWWSPGENGPCGPDTEMFYDISGTFLNGMAKEEFIQADRDQKLVEIWNDVFMEYLKKDGMVVEKLATKNVDTGSGFERIVMVIQGKDNIFDTDLFINIVEAILKESKNKNLKAVRIIADHIRTAVMLISDGVFSSNTDQGYILRRLIRRAVRQSEILQMEPFSILKVSDGVISQYKDVYTNVKEKENEIKNEIKREEEKFRKTLKDGLKQFEKIADKEISGKDAFTLFSTYGFPIELTLEIAKEKNINVDTEGFNEEFKKHQELSRSGAESKFKGGLGDTSEKSLKYHTATHLLHQALRDVLGEEVSQKGSNITSERLRFDFNYKEKLTDEEKVRVENIVNEKIKSNLPVKVITLSKEEALKTGANHFFGDKYGDTVTVYYIGNNIENAYSKEFCGGPHVENTGDLGVFKIIKEEAISAGVRRIKAVLE